MIGLDDTIVAISTPIGEGGIGIVRMSGPQAADILRALFRPSRPIRCGALSCAWRMQPYHLHHGHIFEPATGDAVDEVLAVYMPAPRTYTRQDVVEINGHGGIIALRRILSLCVQHGARLAERGEFTARAFLSGRLDLAQAEAVLDVVRAKTERSLQAAIGQLAGCLSEEVRSVRLGLLDDLAYLEACIDFVDDEIPARDIGPDLVQAIDRLSCLLAEAERGLVYRQGARVAIVGKPNVGKSSLLNQLLRTSRAIVTPIPGTTRDTLEETLNLQGVPVVLVDTAGISAMPPDPIEKLGVERSRAALAQADLALLVVDGSQPLSEADRSIAALIGDKPAIVVMNKADLRQGLPSDDAPILAGRSVSISALTGLGLGELEEAIVETVFAGKVAASDAPLVTNVRHKEALYRALEHTREALASYQSGLAADLVAIDLTAAVNALGEITGQTVSDDLLETIFADFCVGK